MIQETHLWKPESNDAAVQEAAAMGYRAFFEPAVPSQGSRIDAHSSGGVAILVNESLRTEPLVWTGQPGRVIITKVWITSVGSSPLTCVSAYFHAGQGVSDPNREMASELGSFLQPLAPLVIGGDWQALPTELISTNFPKKPRAKVLAPAEGTCRSAKGDFREIVFFVVSDGAAQLMKSRCSMGSPTHTCLYVSNLLVMLTRSWL